MLFFTSTCPDVVAKNGPVFFEEPDGTDEPRGENSPDTKDLLVLAEATEHLGVHALEGVRAKDGFIGGGVICVGIIWSLFEVGAFVIAG